MKAESSQTLVTESVPECPLCYKAGEIYYTGLKDIAWPTPGEWTYRNCVDCEVLWLDPRPKTECFGIIYPEDYVTHVQPTDSLLTIRPSLIGGLRLEVKLEVLHRAYGYHLTSHKLTSWFIGMLAAHIPAVKRWAGYAVRFLQACKGRLLDVGCGNGEFIYTMSNLGWQVCGIEPDRMSAALGRKVGLKILDSSVECVPLEPNNLDAITLN